MSEYTYEVYTFNDDRVKIAHILRSDGVRRWYTTYGLEALLSMMDYSNAWQFGLTQEEYEQAVEEVYEDE